ncbi:hypothetical protein [Streptomyces sp. NPDC090994]|uniref:hypothetical protein n=1 Tax=Streptomyces sp. NPDC090994 TaxID=3365969 RepID=UPI003801F211
MTEGLFAVLGALVGATGAWIAALIAGRAARYQADTQARTAHEQWLRQIRRDAYASYLSKAQTIVRMLFDFLVQENLSPAEREDRRRDVWAAWVPAGEAAQSMAMEAPAEVAELVVQFGAAFGALTHNERAGAPQERLLGECARLFELLNEISGKCRASIQESS